MKIKARRFTIFEITSFFLLVFLVSAAISATVTYQYDEAGRLIREAYESGSIIYTYDENGNLISRNYSNLSPVPSGGPEVGMELDPSQAPVRVNGEELEVSFGFQDEVDILVGMISCDFKRVYWLNSACSLSEDFALPVSRGTVFSCSGVSLPMGSGYVFWMVTGVPLTGLDWGADPYVLKFYMVGSCAR